jgi:hypothetical protein
MAKSLLQKLIIRNIVEMIVAGLQPIKRLWKSIMRKKQLDRDKKDTASHARHL